MNPDFLVIGAGGAGLRAAIELAGAGQVRIVARCALAREESRGAQFRTDFPGKRAEFEKHSVISKDSGVRFE